MTTDVILILFAAAVSVGIGAGLWWWMGALDQRKPHEVELAYCHPCRAWVGDADLLAIHQRLEHGGRPLAPEDDPTFWGER